MVDKRGCKFLNKSRRIESHDPTVTGMLGYNDTTSICRLVSNACQASRHIILKFYHDRHSKSGLADSIDAHAELDAVRTLAMLALHIPLIPRGVLLPTQPMTSPFPRSSW